MRTSGQKEKKKVLKESALLEMDGNRVYQELRKFFSTSIPYLIRLRFFSGISSVLLRSSCAGIFNRSSSGRFALF